MRASAGCAETLLAVSFSPTVHATPPLACGRARPPGEVEPSTAQAFRLAALSAQFAGAGQVPGVGRRVGRRVERGRSPPFPHVRAALLPGREGKDLKVGIRPPVPPRVPSPQIRESGLGSVNSQTGYAKSPGSSPKPMDAHCPVLPGWGAGGRHVPPGPERPWGSGIRSRLPLSRPRRAEGSAPADGAESAPAFPASPARRPESGISAWQRGPEGRA